MLFGVRCLHYVAYGLVSLKDIESKDCLRCIMLIGESILIDLVDKLFTLGTGCMLLFRKFTHSCQALRRCTLTIDYNLFVLQVLICVGGE